MNPRFILGAAAAAAAVLAMPSFASAATACSYDTTKRQVDIQLANPTFGGQTAILRVSGGYIKVADNNELPRSCFIPGFSDLDHAAIVDGTNKIRVTGSPNFEHVLVSERDGSFTPGSLTNPDGGRRHIQLALLTGTGNDVIDVEGDQFDDAMSVFGGHIGGQVDMDNDGDTDLAVSAPGRINLIGGSGNDRLAAFGIFGSPALMPVTLDGGEGNDTLFGGQTGGDLLLGGNGNADFINSVAGGADVVAGGDGFLDQAFVDSADTVSTVEVKTVKVGKLGGSARTIKGDAGETLSLPLAWTHPKAWKQLRSIEAIAFDGAKRVGTIKLTPTGTSSATGELSIDRDATKIGHHGKTVTAELGLKIAKSLKGRTLSVDIAATDRKGHRQLQPAARSIRVNP
jgi:hypothetical protein